MTVLSLTFRSDTSPTFIYLKNVKQKEGKKLLTQSPQKQPPHVSAVTPQQMEVRSPPVFK
jgi:hypothetical protein